MPYVEIYKLNNDGDQKVIAICELVDQNVSCRGDQALIDNLNKAGIINQASILYEVIYPKDGALFLANFKYNFTSGYLNASDIK